MLSVIIPVLNEVDNIVSLVSELVAVRADAAIGEILYVDDGSTDGTIDVLRHEQIRCPMLRVVRHERRMGQSAAFLSGARAASNNLLVFMDGDGQNDPRDIAHLLAEHRRAPSSDAVAVLGQRVGRKDAWSRRLSSGIANKVRRAVLNDSTRDTGCSLKLVGRSDYLALPYFDHMHRFLPALLMRNGVALRHVDVTHRPRTKGTSKYGVRNRAVVGAVDLLGSAWLIRRRLPGDYATTEIDARIGI